MNYAKPLFVVASLTLAACSGTPGEVDEQTGTTQQAAIVANAIVANAIVANAIVANAIVANAIVANALTSHTLTSSAIIAGALDDPNARELLEYTVSCALSPDQSVTFEVDGVTYTYAGELGLAPGWGAPGGSCDGECQEWVSACLLARVDYLGQTHDISLRGVNSALAVSPTEQHEYTVREATYFGNVFTKPQERYACLSPGQTEILRVCGPTLEGCVVDVDATCDKVCGGPTGDGAFTNCRPHDGDWDDPSYHGSITVFLRPGEP
jgi:hypothetical protein